MAIKTIPIKHWRDPLNLILGLWMVVSPWILTYQAETNPTWNAVILGILIAAVALVALFRVMALEEWANVVLGVRAWKECANGVLGVWLAGSPWILGFSGLIGAMRNAVFVGFVVATIEFMYAFETETDKNIGGGRSPTT